MNVNALSESLDSPYGYKFNSHPMGTSGFFRIGSGGDRPISMAANLFGDGIAELIFTSHSRKDKYGLTGRGDAFRIFATVMDFARKTLKKSDIDVLVFTAKEKSRRKLYQRLLKVGGRGLMTASHPDGYYAISTNAKGIKLARDWWEYEMSTSP